MPYKLFFTTDVHGSERCFRKFVNAAKFYGVQAIILGGDITGKAIIPIIEQGNGTYSVQINNTPKTITKDDLEGTEKEIRFNGYYPYITNPDELSELEKDPHGKDKLFRAAIRDSLTKWFAIAEERLKPDNIKVYVSPGNDDDKVVDEVLAASDFIINPEEKIVELEDGIQMMSYGYSNPTPWDSPRELPEEELLKHLTALAEKMDYSKVTVFNIHVPPYDTTIDQAPKLDSTLKPIVEGGQVAMAGCGSKAVRSVIEKYQPTISLHGHVHESSGSVRIGKTMCLNPGSEYNDGVLRGAIVTINPGRKKTSYLLTVG